MYFCGVIDGQILLLWVLLQSGHHLHTGHRAGGHRFLGGQECHGEAAGGLALVE